MVDGQAFQRIGHVGPAHAELVELHASDSELRVQLLTENGVLTIRAPLGRAAGQLVCRLYAIQGPAPGCELAREDVQAARADR
jgi:hypothetical protein